MSDQVTPEDLFKSIVQDPRFEQLPVDKRLKLIDNAVESNLTPESSWDEMREWNVPRAQARLIARNGVEAVHAALKQAGEMGPIHPLLLSEEYLGDLNEVAAKSGGSRGFAADQGDPIKRRGESAQVTLAEGDNPVSARVMPHPTMNILEVDTPKGPRRMEFGSIDDLPKTGDGWGKMIVDNFADDFELGDMVTGHSPLAPVKAAAAGAVQSVMNIPFDAQGILSSIKDYQFLKQNTISDDGSVVPMTPDQGESLDNWAGTQQIKEGLPTGPTRLTEGRQRFDELRNEIHLKALGKQKVKVFGETVDGKFIADDRFAPLETDGDGNRKPFLKEGDEVSKKDLFLAQGKARQNEFLGDAYRDYRTRMDAANELYGKTNQDALRALRDGMVQRAANIATDAAGVTGQAAPIIALAPTGPAGMGLAGYGTSHAGHYSETFGAIYQDAKRSGLDDGEALQKANEGALRAAELAAPVDAVGDATLGLAFKGMGGIMKMLPPATKSGMAKRLAGALNEASGHATFGDKAAGALGASLAQFASEASGEMIRSTVEDQYQNEKDGFQKNAQQALYEGFLALVSTGAMGTTSQVTNWAGNQLEARRLQKVMDGSNVTKEELEAAMRGTSEDRSAFAKKVMSMAEANKVKTGNRHAPSINGSPIIPAGQAIEEEKPAEQPQVSKISPEFTNQNIEPDEHSKAAFAETGTSAGDIIEFEGQPVRLLGTENDASGVSFRGITPSGETMFLTGDQIKGQPILSLNEAIRLQNNDPESTVTFPAEDPAEPAPAAAPPLEDNSQLGGEQEQRVATVPDPEGDWVVGPAATFNAGPNEKPTGPLTFTGGGIDLTKHQSSTFELRGYRGNPTLEGTEAAPAPKPEDEGQTSGPAVVAPEIRQYPIAKSAAFWNKTFGNDTGLTVMAPQAGNPGSRLTLGKGSTGTVQSVATLARLVGSDSLLIPGMSNIPVMVRPLSSMPNPAGTRGATISHSTRALFAHAVLDSNGQLFETEALILDSNTFGGLDAERQKRYIDHEIRHAHVRRAIQAATKPGASPEHVQLLKDFEAMGREFIAAYEKDPSLWGGVGGSVKNAITRGEPVEVSDELLAYALTDPSVAEAMKRFNPDFTPREPGQQRKEGDFKNLWERIMDFFKRAFQLAGLSKGQAAQEVANLDPATAQTRIEAFASQIAKVASGRTYKSEAAAMKKAEKMGLRKFKIVPDENGNFTISVPLQGARPEDVFSGASLSLGGNTSAVADAMVQTILLTPDYVAPAFMGTDTGIGNALMDATETRQGYAREVADTGVQLWNTGLKDFATWSRAMRKIFPTADLSGAWDTMNQAILQGLASGGLEGTLALKFKGDAAGLQAYRRDLAAGGRGEQAVNSIIEQASVPYASVREDSALNPNTAIITYGPNAKKWQRFITLDPKGKIVSTEVFKEAWNKARKTGDAQKIQEFTDLAGCVEQYKTRQKAVRSAKYKLKNVAIDRMGMEMFPEQVAEAIWQDALLNGPNLTLINQAFARFNPDKKDKVQKLVSDLKWYRKRHLEIHRKDPSRLLNEPKLQEVSRAAAKEAYLQGKNDGKRLGSAVLNKTARYTDYETGWSKEDNLIRRALIASSANPSYAPSNDPLYSGVVVDRLSNGEVGDIGAQGRFTAEETKAALGDMGAYKYRQGIMDGIRSEFLTYFAGQYDGAMSDDPTKYILPLMMGVPIDKGFTFTVGNLDFDGDMDLFDAVIGPALVKAFGQGIRKTGVDSGVTFIKQMRKEWHSSMEKARERFKKDPAAGWEAASETDFAALVQFNPNLRDLFRFFDSWDNGEGGWNKLPGTALNRLVNLRKAFGTEWTVPWGNELNTDLRTQDRSGGYSHEWVSRGQRREENTLREEMAKSLIFLADYDKRKATALAVGLFAMDGSESLAGAAHKLEEMLLDRATPEITAQSLRSNTAALIPSLARHLGADPKDVTLALSLGGGTVLSLGQVITSATDASSQGQLLANDEINRLAEDAPVLVMDSSLMGESITSRLNLGMLGETSRNVAGIRFTTIPANEEAQGNEWGAPFNVVDVSGNGGLSNRPGTLSGILGAANIVSIEQANSKWFQNQGRNALRGMGELAVALGDAYPIIKKLSEANTAQAELFAKALASLDNLARAHGKPRGDAAGASKALSQIPAGTLAAELLVNPELRQALLVIPDIFENTRVSRNKGSINKAKEIVEADQNELMRRWSESSAVLNPDTGAVDGLYGDYESRTVTGGRSRFNGSTEAAEAFDDAFDDALGIDHIASDSFHAENGPFAALDDLRQTLAKQATANYKNEIEGFLDNGFAQRQVAMAIEVVRLAAEARKRGTESPYAFAMPKQEVMHDYSNNLPVPMPDSDVREATANLSNAEQREAREAERGVEISKLIDSTDAAMSDRALQRIGKRAEELLASQPVTYEMWEEDPEGDPTAIATAYRAATGPGSSGILMKGNHSVTDPAARRAQAELDADNYIASVLPNVVANEIATRPFTQKWFNQYVRNQLVDLVDLMLEPSSSDATVANIRSKIHFAFGSDQPIVRRTADLRWHVLLDSWRENKAPRLALQLLSATRGKINAVPYWRRAEVLKNFASNDAIFRKLGAKSPAVLDQILNVAMIMEYGARGDGGFTNFRSATMELEKTFDKINSQLGPYAEEFVAPLMVGQFLSYAMDSSPTASVTRMLSTVAESIKNLQEKGSSIAHGAHKEIGLYKEMQARITPIADAFVNGLIDKSNYEAQMLALLSPPQTKWMKDTKAWFDEIRPVMEIVSRWTGKEQGAYEGYLPLLNARMDGATSMEDYNYRPVGESVGASRSRMHNARYGAQKSEAYMADYNGSRVVNKARAALFSMMTTESNLLLHDLLGTIQSKPDGNYEWKGHLDRLADPSTGPSAKHLGMTPEEQSKVQTFTGALRMVFDRERTGFQSGLHIDNRLRRIMIRSQQAGAYFALADLEQLYKQTVPAMAVFASRLAFEPSMALSYASTLSSILRPSRRREIKAAMQDLVPSVATRGLDGQEDMAKKLAIQLIRKPRGLSLGIRLANSGRRVVAKTFDAMRLILDWTTGKPDGFISRLTWAARYEHLQRQAGKDPWKDHSQANAYKAQQWMEEVMSQSELTRRGNWFQDKGGSVPKEFLITSIRAFGSFSASMASHADAAWTELYHGPNKARSVAKLAEISAQQLLFRLLAKPFRDLALSYVGKSLFGWDEDERRRRYLKMLTEDPNSRKTKPIESVGDAWSRYGWRFLAESALMASGGPSWIGATGYVSSLPVVGDLEATLLTGAGESMKEAFGLDAQKARGYSVQDLAEKPFGYAGVAAGRGLDVANMTLQSGAKGKLGRDWWRLAVMAGATRGVSARMQQELQEKMKPKKAASW